MRTLIAWILPGIFGSILLGNASAQTTPPQAKSSTARPPATSSKAAQAPLDPAAVQAQQLADKKALEDMNPILADWEVQSKKISSLVVEIDRIDSSPAHGKQYFKGQALLRSPDLACLEFRKFKTDPDGKPLSKLDANNAKIPDLEKDPFQRMVCTGQEVVQYVYKNKIVYVYPLDKQIRNKALQEGPLPFLFNMKAAEARRRYGMRLMKADGDFYQISIVPREEIDKQSFEIAFLWLRKKDFLPEHLQLVKMEKEIEDYRFRNIQPNKIIDDTYFQPVVNMKDWQVKRNPQEGVQEPQQPQPTARRPAQQPAMRPGPTAR